MIERSLIPAAETPFVVDGFCIGCQQPQAFRATFASAFLESQGGRVPNWREHLVCVCGLNARTRAAVHLLTTTLARPADARVYIMEQRSPLHAGSPGASPISSAAVSWDKSTSLRDGPWTGFATKTRHA